MQHTNSPHRAQKVPPPTQHPNIKFVDVPLAFTAQFFDILYEDVAELDRLQIEQREQLKVQIIALSSELRKLTRPSKTMFHKSDLYAWRKLFDLYLQGNIFFSTRELDHGKRTAVEAGVQLQWFQDEVKKNNLAFRIPASYQALEQFIGINTVILMTQKFQELNKQAVSKILKSRLLSLSLDQIRRLDECQLRPCSFEMLLPLVHANIKPRIRQEDHAKIREHISNPLQRRRNHVRQYSQGPLRPSLHGSGQDRPSTRRSRMSNL